MATTATSGFEDLQFDPVAAIAHLARADADLGALIEQAGPFTMRPDTSLELYDALARSIVFQQLAGAAAATIFGRVCALVEPPGVPQPEQLLALEEDALRGAGLSAAKLAALRDLATHALREEIPTREEAAALDDAELERQLTRVRGIGPWTVHMALMFHLGRPDVLPVGDYGVRSGAALLDGRDEPLSPRELAERAEPWRPYRSVASWYLWRAVDLSREKNND